MTPTGPGTFCKPLKPWIPGWLGEAAEVCTAVAEVKSKDDSAMVAQAPGPAAVRLWRSVARLRLGLVFGCSRS